MWVYVAAVLVLGASVQTAIGFGMMLVAVTLGAWAVPLEQLLPVLLPVSMVQTGLVVLRHPQRVDVGRLLRQMLPWMALGASAAAIGIGPGRAAWLKPGLGVVVVGLAAIELRRGGEPAPRRPWQTPAALVAAGVLQGLFAVGGPMAVWALGREDLDRHRFRTTLAALWFLVNTVVVGSMVWDGRVNPQSMGTSAALVVPALVGLGLGELAHDWLDEARFRRILWGLLAVAGLPLIFG